MKTKAFFGKDGITMTSAKYISNIAKERYETLERSINSLDFCKKTVSLIGENRKTILSKGDTLDGISDILQEIITCKSLIAFLMEAIKEKERLDAEAVQYVDAEARNAMEVYHRQEYLTEEDIVKTWTVGQQEKYLSVQTKAAVIGKFIHPDMKHSLDSGALNIARKRLADRIKEPITAQTNGRDTLIYEYTPVVSQEEVDRYFFTLQAEQRSAQAEFNGMKNTIEQALKEDKLQKDLAYRAASQKADDTLRAIVANENIKRQELQKEVAALKIVIPNNLKEIYEKLSK